MNLAMRWPFGQKASSGSAIVHPGGGGGGLFGAVGQMFSSSIGLMNSTKFDWEKEVPDPYKASVLMAPLNWLMATFPEAPICLDRYDTTQGRWEPEQDQTQILDLLDNPNPFYSGEAMLMTVALDLSFGNAFLLKLRNAGGKVVQLWWLPRQLMRPRYPSDGSKFIDYWEYRPNGSEVRLDPKDVIHIRFGLDPRDPRMGLSRLGSLVRETAIDEQASNFTATVLKNLGIIGTVISPKVAAQGTRAKTVSAESVKQVKDYIIRQFTGDRRGDPLVLGSPTEVTLLQHNMQGFDVGPIRDVSEERVCAAMGIPAAVVGFGTGLQQTKVGATMKEMRQLAWTTGVIPMQRIVANELRRSLLPEFIPGATRSTYRLKFDVGTVPLLWETPTERSDRIRKDYDSGIIKRGEARLESGRSAPDEADDTYKANPTPASNGGDPNKPPETAPPADPGEGDSNA